MIIICHFEILLNLQSMTNKVLFLPLGPIDRFHDIVMSLSPDGSGMKIKNKYYEADIEFDLQESSSKPHAVIWIGNADYCDSTPPDSSKYEESELKLLLRVCPPSSSKHFPESSKKLQDWEIESMSEIINVDPETFDEEVQKFREGNGRSSLLDEELQPAGCRLLEALEMVDWPLKLVSGKNAIDQKIDNLKHLLSNADDPELEGFDHAMTLMMELQKTIPNLPDDERRKYAAKVAMAFDSLFDAAENEMINNEEDKPEIKEDKPEIK